MRLFQSQWVYLNLLLTTFLSLTGKTIRCFLSAMVCRNVRMNPHVTCQPSQGFLGDPPGSTGISCTLFHGRARLPERRPSWLTLSSHLSFTGLINVIIRRTDLNAVDVKAGPRSRCDSLKIHNVNCDLCFLIQIRVDSFEMYTLYAEARSDWKTPQHLSIFRKTMQH